MAKGSARAKAKPAKPRPTSKAKPKAKAKAKPMASAARASKSSRVRPDERAGVSKRAKRAGPKRAKRAGPKAAPDKRAGSARASKSARARKPRKTSKPRPDPVAAKPAHIALSSSPTNTVVQILDADDPVAALRDFLSTLPGPITPEQGQVALGAAQLALLPMTHEHRGGPQVKELLDLVLDRWTDFPDRTGFHAQELLRNAFAAVGDDRERVAKLTALVPIDASPELRYNVAASLAVAGQRDAMLRAVEAALAVGASTGQFIRDPDFAELVDDPEMRALLSRTTAPVIPVDTTPFLAPISAALESVISTLEELGDTPSLAAPASLDAIIAAERVAKIQLPNEYRALLEISDGPKLWEYRFLGTADFHGATELASQARSYLETARGPTGIDACVPLANCGQPTDWLLYDPHGRIRGGKPGIVMVQSADELAFDGLVSALEHLETVARDVLETN